MKVLAINGSPRKDGNTALMIRRIFERLEAEQIETEMVQLAGQSLRGCIACMVCRQRKDQRCVIEGDILNQLIEKMVAADAIILGSPTYFTDVTAEMKALIDRAGVVARGNGSLFRRKVGVAVTALRRGGALHTLETLQNFFLINEMIIPGSTYWNLGFGKGPGDVAEDAEGMGTLDCLADNLVWLLKKICDKSEGGGR